MGRLKKNIESVMHSDYKGSVRPLDTLLYAASRVYAGAVKLRGAGFRAGLLPVKQLPCRVISIGNISAGGTGKTPMTIYLARRMQQMGYRPAVLSRGYKGGAEKTGAVVSDGHNILANAPAVGDEPFLMACRLPGVPVLVGANRYRSGLRAVAEFDPDTIILDDGFQHRQLHRDMDLVLIDAGRGPGNGHLIPRGMLREPLSALWRADAMVLTRSEDAHQSPGIAFPPGIPVFRAGHVPYLAGVYKDANRPAVTVSDRLSALHFGDLKGRRVYAFSGIAQNREFREMMAAQIGPLCGYCEFSDHYDYTDRDLQAIERHARSRAAEYLLTTEKDFVRIAGRMPEGLPLAVAGVEVRFLDAQEEGRFLAIVRQKLSEAG